MLQNKTIAITGSEGFVGSHLVRKIMELNARVIKIDLNHKVDVTDWSQLENLDKFDVLIHLSAKTFVPESYKEPRHFYHTNIVGTLNALELCRLNNAKMIYASSYVYGLPKYIPVDEGHPIQGFNPYAESKIIGERLCERYYHDFNVGVIIMRPFNIYGPNQNKKFLIPSMIEQARNGEIVLKDPMPKRDFVFIDDVVNAYIKAIQYDKTGFEIINLGLGKSYSVREIAGEVIRNFDEAVNITFTNEKRISEIPDTVADISKAKALLGWEPEISIEHGINKCVHNLEDLYLLN